MSTRSARPDIRNPVAQLPAMSQVLALLPSDRHALAVTLKALYEAARHRADTLWHTRKSADAVYWRALAVYALHISRAVRPQHVNAPPRRKRAASAADRSSVSPATRSNWTADLLALPPEVRVALSQLLVSLSRHARHRAEKSWSQKKGPMASYWRSVAYHALATSRLIRPSKAAFAPVSVAIYADAA